MAQRLITLDAVWTAELRQPRRRRRGRAIADMRALADDLGRALEEARARAFEVRQILDRTSDDAFDEGMRVLREQPTGAQPIVSDLFLGRAPRTLVMAGCDFVVAHAPAEQDLIEQDFARLERGENPSGDFRPGFRCALFLLAIGAAVASIIGLSGPTTFVVLGVASQFANAVVGWQGARCPSFGPTIEAEPPAAAPATRTVRPTPGARARAGRPTSDDGQPCQSTALNPHRGQHMAVFFLGLVALACAAGVVLVVLHHSTGTSTAAITAMSSLGAAAVGGIAGIVTGITQTGPRGKDSERQDTHR